MSRSDPDAVRQRYTAAGAVWPPAFDHLVRHAPEFVDAYLDFSVSSPRHGALEPKVRELVHVALDIATTHMDGAGARLHIQQAVRLGATQEELIHVCLLATLLGVHTMPMAVPILVEELAGAGAPLDIQPSLAGLEVKERFIADRGSLPEDVEPMIALHHEYLDSYRRLSRIAVAEGVLEPKVVELIIIALDASTTHLHAGGTRLHIRNALAKGATVDEILEVLELTSTIGICGTNLGVQLVAEAFGDA